MLWINHIAYHVLTDIKFKRNKSVQPNTKER